MRYYKELANFNTFTLKEAATIIGKISTAKKYLKKMIETGYIKNIRKNLYTCYDVALNEDCANRFQIASNINQHSYVSYHTAFEFYGCYNQVYSEVQTSTTKRFSPFEYDGYAFKCYPNDITIQIDTIQGAKVTSIERTIVDSINMLGKVMDIEELLNCIDLVQTVDEEKLLETLNAYHKEVLYRKVGYILSFYKKELKLSNVFFKTCMSKGVVSNCNFIVNADKKNLIYDSKWGIYVYPHLNKMRTQEAV